MFENCTIKKVNDTQKIILVPLSEENRHYQDILEWVAEVDENGESKGNTIEEAD